ncbi:hypothetical protein [Bosea sp. (in: a-proteobacteria)]|uniref:hypothetical protein n=1 Tax=Bosea sp. (in: a-proteobacteria) TaxID=1871050 RepID=UPI003B3B62DF
MLIVVTPASTSALTTASRAAAMLGVLADAALSMAIDTASSMIVDYCRRPFAAETVRETFRSPRDGLLLSRAPVTNIEFIEEAGAALAAPDYELDGQRLFRVSGACRIDWHLIVSVTYTAGYSLPADNGTWTLPAAVERAAILVAGAILSNRTRDPMMRSESVEGVGSSSWWIPESCSLPSPEADTLLTHYRKIL